jgi:alpha/beta superfamily hydrolase
MTARALAEQPCFFGPARDLIGVYHPADAPAERAVVLCAPLGQEQIRCHRLYRQLATTLAADGTPVLRFDYHGTGDAAGASHEVELERCVADAVIAAAELRERCGAREVVAFGARLGGNVAMAAARQACFTDVLAWDPVVDGAVHVAQLDTMQQMLRVDTQRFIRPRAGEDIAGQWLGFDVSERLRAQIAGLRIHHVDSPTVVFTAAELHPLRTAADVTLVVIKPAAPWLELARLEMAVLSHPMIQAVSAYMREPA